MRRPWILLLCLAAASLPACDSLYYKTMKKFGVEKRDILVKRVRSAQEAQQEGKQEFRDALEKFRSVVAVEGGSLEDKYKTLDDTLQDAEKRADEIHDRVKAVKDVAGDLFKEWEKEIGTYSDRTLKAESQRELRETRRRADAVIAAMERAEKRIDPVLQPLRDRVLFLKHNLNARAIGALDKELATVSTNVDTLVADLETSIAEADAFIRQMDAEAAAAPATD
jgi:hypothetical protein